MHPRRRNLLALVAIIAALAPHTTHAATRRQLGLGKWADGPPTEIDCSITPDIDFSYYIERCWDEITQWWVNGMCVSGVKKENSELHRCMRPDGSRPHCHDCMNENNGNTKHVCGADNPDHDQACDIAWEGTAQDCGEPEDQELTVYSHMCSARPGTGNSETWYLRENFYCGDEVYKSGPNMEEDYPTEFTCGQEWYYAFEEDDELMAKNHPELLGMEHAFSYEEAKYCLDCGRAIQVCASDADATCEGLGLPAKGGGPVVNKDSIDELSVGGDTGAATTPVPTPKPTPNPTDAAEPDEGGDAQKAAPAVVTPASTESPPKETPAPTEPKESPVNTPAPSTSTPTTYAPTTYAPTEAEESSEDEEEEEETAAPEGGAVTAQNAPSSASLRSNGLLVVAGVVGWTFTLFV